MEDNQKSNITPDLVIQKISPDKEKSVNAAWERVFEERKGEILDREDVEKIIKERSHSNAFREISAVPIPGGFDVGDDPQAFYLLYKKLCGEDAARMQLEHELEHYNVYCKYGIPATFGVIISRLPDDRSFVIPMVSPHFPEDMSPEERTKIAYEANMVVTEKSVGDQNMIDSYTQEEI